MAGGGVTTGKVSEDWGRKVLGITVLKMGKLDGIAICDTMIDLIKDRPCQTYFYEKE
jgi:hypothetical protein